MKKFISMLMVIAMLFVTFNFVLADNTKNKKTLIRAARIENVGSDGKKLKTNIMDKGKNEIAKPAVSFEMAKNGNLKLKGKINNVPFDITATPYKVPVNPNVQAFKPNDSCGNYTVLYVAMEKEIDKSVKYFNDTKPEDYYMMIKLYMRTNGSEDIVVVETFTNKDYFKELAKRNPKKNEVVNFDEERESQLAQFWYAKVFKPKVKVIEESHSTVRSKSNGITRLYKGIVKWFKTFSLN